MPMKHKLGRDSLLDNNKEVLTCINTCLLAAGDDAASIEFAVEFEHRANDKLDRKEVIDIVAKAVQAPHK